MKKRTGKGKVVAAKPPSLAAYEKEEPMTKSDCTCPVCMNILIDPVTFKCKHSVCYKCLQSMVEKSNVNCPCCRERLNTFCRKNKMDMDKIINSVFKARLEQEYSQAISSRLEELKREEAGQDINGSQNPIIPDDSGFFNDDNSGISHILDGTISKPGEIREELNAIYLEPKKALEREKQAEEQASQAVVDEILKKEPFIAERIAQIEKDYELAKLVQETEEQSEVIIEPNNNQNSQRSAVFTVTPVSQSKRKTTFQNPKAKNKNKSSSRSSIKKSRKRPSSSSNTSNKRNRLNSTFSPSTSGNQNSSSTNSSKEDTVQLRIDNFFVRSPSVTSTTSTISNSSLERIIRSSPPFSPADSGYSHTPASANTTTTSTAPTTSNYTFCLDDEQPGPSRVYIPEIITTSPQSFDRSQSFNFSQLRGDSDSDDDVYECNSPSLLEKCSPSLLENCNNSPGPSTQNSTLSSLLLHSSEGSSSVPPSPSYPLKYFAKDEDQEIQEQWRRIQQEEQDRKLALQLSRQLAQGVEYRGRGSKEKYSIREWCKKGQ